MRIGGRLAQDCIRKVEDFPAFIVVDDKGNDFSAHFMRPTQ